MTKTPTVSASRFRCSRLIKAIFLMSIYFPPFSSISCVAQRTPCYYYHFAHFSLYYKRGHSLLFGLWCTSSHQHGWANRKMDRKTQLICFSWSRPIDVAWQSLGWEKKSTASTSTQHEVFQTQHAQHTGRKWNVEWLRLLKGEDGATPEENETFCTCWFSRCSIFLRGWWLLLPGVKGCFGWGGKDRKACFFRVEDQSSI